MEAYGIKGKIFNWIKEFLTGRTQTVKVNGTGSTLADVLSGIPQGSVLGPLLFVIYINDILDNIKANGLLFADDTRAYRTIVSKEDAEELQCDLFTLDKWSQDWLLGFNAKKCHVLTTGKFENTRYTKRYKLSNVELEHVSSEKDLGIQIDSDLTFDDHISAKTRVANAMVGLIRRSFAHLDSNSFKKLYAAFVRPHLEYGQSAWSPHLVRHQKKIEDVQIRATKLVENLGKLTYRERLERLNLPSLQFRRLRGDMIELYKHFNTYDKDTLSPSFQPRGRTTRSHQFQLLHQKSHDGIRGVQTNSFYHRTVDAWNNLPRKVVGVKTIIDFKDKFDELMRKKMFEISNEQERRDESSP